MLTILTIKMIDIAEIASVAFYNSLDLVSVRNIFRVEIMFWIAVHEV